VRCELTLVPVGASAAMPTHFAVLLTETTARHERVDQLLDTEAKYRGMFEHAVEGIYQSTPDGRYLAINPALAKMYGYTSAQEMLDQVSDIQNQIYADPSFRDRFRREVEQSDHVENLEYQVRHRDGRNLWISESARAVRDAHGTVRYYEGFIDNITQRKEAEAARARLEKEMIQAQKMEAMGTLAGGIAHDFNNILCAMLGLTELTLADQQMSGQSRKNLQAVLRSADRAKDLVGQILTFSRRGEIEHQPLRLGAILSECVKLLNATLPSSITVSLACETEEDTVVANPTEIHQVIMNLGTNAGHAMRQNGGRLEFTLQGLELDAGQTTALPPLRPGPHLALTVRDNGHGMSQEVLESIFDPFFTTKGPGQGTGLGLALVHRIIGRCSGHIAVKSEPGQGTTFTIHLPRTAEAAVAPVASKNRLLLGRREWLLVVDDEMPILSMMQQHLRNMGYRVITRADSTEALETFRNDPTKFSLVITDHTMPRMQGLELAERLGEIRPDLPLVLMTGLNQQPDFTGSRHAARRTIIKKPIDFIDLSHRLRGFLDET
jgi:two-component system cell cycle sensor histidine kinase/response regulator CckA